MSSYAAEFLRQFVDDTPWVHIDIAGTAWGLGRPYVGKGASGLRRPPARRTGEKQRLAGKKAICELDHRWFENRLFWLPWVK